MTDKLNAPIHFWIVAVLSALWNAFGAYNYLLSMKADEAFLADYPPEIVEMLENFPVWATSLWAIGVWFSVLGTILLFLRKSAAATAFLISFAGALGSFVYQFSLGKPESVEAGMHYGMPVIVLVAILAQWIYARRMAGNGVLS